MTDRNPEPPTQSQPQPATPVTTSRGNRAWLAILIILGIGALDYMAHHPWWLLLLLIPVAWFAYQFWAGWQRAQSDLQVDPVATHSPRRSDDDGPSTWE